MHKPGELLRVIFMLWSLVSNLMGKGDMCWNLADIVEGVRAAGPLCCAVPIAQHLCHF